MSRNRLLNIIIYSAIVLLTSCLPNRGDKPWQPAAGPLLTRWAHEVSPDNALPEYPRPQMARPDWQSLNGLWDYAITGTEAATPATFQAKILVPFPLESALSGVMKNLKPNELLWYRRTFSVPREWSDRNILLHFGSVDWQSDVFVNGKKVAGHKGGYDPFSINITEALNPGSEQELVVRVWEPN